MQGRNHFYMANYIVLLDASRGGLNCYLLAKLAQLSQRAGGAFLTTLQRVLHASLFISFSCVSRKLYAIISRAK